MKMKEWIENSKLGCIINGTSHNSTHRREKHDFYATDSHSVNLFLEIIKKTMYELTCGQGHI